MAEVYGADPRRWWMVAAMSLLLCMSVGGLGATGVSVDSAKDFYGVSSAVFNAVYYMPYVDFLIGMVVAYWIMHTWNIYVVVCVAGLIQVVGYAVQSAYQYSFWPLIIGGMIVDSTRAFVWLVVPTYVARWFEVQRMSIAYGVIFFAASVVALGIVTAVRFSISSAGEYRDRLLWFIVAFMTTSAVLSVFCIFWFADAPVRKPGPQSVAPKTGSLLKPDFPERNKAALIKTIVLYIISVGPTWAFSNLALAIMNNHNYTNSDITLVALVGFVAGLFTSLIIGSLQSLTRQYEWITCAMVWTVTAVFSAIPFVLDKRDAFIGLTAAFQWASGAYSMAFATTATELAYPVHESFVTFIMFGGAQISGLLATLLASFDASFTAAMWLFLSIYWATSVVSLVGQFAFPGSYGRVNGSGGRKPAAETGGGRRNGMGWMAMDYAMAQMPIYTYESAGGGSSGSGGGGAGDSDEDGESDESNALNSSRS